MRLFSWGRMAKGAKPLTDAERPSGREASPHGRAGQGPAQGLRGGESARSRWRSPEAAAELPPSPQSLLCGRMCTECTPRDFARGFLHKDRPPPAGRGLLHSCGSCTEFGGGGAENSMSELASEYLLRLARGLFPLQIMLKVRRATPPHRGGAGVGD